MRNYELFKTNDYLNALKTNHKSLGKTLKNLNKKNNCKSCHKHKDYNNKMNCHLSVIKAFIRIIHWTIVVFNRILIQFAAIMNHLKMNTH